MEVSSIMVSLENEEIRWLWGRGHKNDLSDVWKELLGMADKKKAKIGALTFVSCYKKYKLREDSDFD